MNRYLLSAAVWLTLAASPLAAQSDPAQSPGAPQRPMTAEDLIRLNRLAAPAVSPDGRFVVYQLTTTQEGDYARATGLYVVDTTRVNGDNGVAIVNLPEANETSAAFSSDGRRLYFLSNKSGRDQLWFANVNVTAQGLTAGAPVQASDTIADVTGFRLAPDGRAVLLMGEVALGCPNFGCNSNSGLSPAQPGPGTARVYDEMFVRHWDHWETPGTYNRTYRFALGTDGRVSGTGQDVAGNLVGDTPSQPFGGGEEVAFSADGRQVFFTLRIADRNEPTSTNLDIYVTPVEGGAPVNLTDNNDATDSLPSPSPDGRTLAYVAMARPGYEADQQTLMLRDLRSGTVRAIDWTRSVASIAWAPDSRSLYITAQDTLEHPVYRVDAANGQITRLTTTGSINDVTPLPRGAILYTVNSLAAPNDLVIRRANGQTQRLTNVNADVLSARSPVHYEQYSFTGANGDRVYGQILTPMGAAGPLPTVLMVHGGPQGSFGNGWSNRWNPALWAAQGYAVVTIDFHGSTGYGQAFTDSINRNWGGWPLEDLRLGFAAAAATNRAVDTGNACAAGASYGGYMMNWIAGNWPDGFRCLITHAGIFDLRAMAFETEELWFDEWDHGGPWWSRDPVERERWNPVNHVTNWRSPTLVIHGERDFRIPYSQSLAAFTALQRQGIESRLVVFPDENHWITRARNSLQWHNEVFGWLHRHLRSSPAP